MEPGDRGPPSLAELAAGQILVGIDEETALVSGTDGWRVEGRQKVWIVEADGRRTPHPAGAVLALLPTARGTTRSLPENS